MQRAASKTRGRSIDERIIVPHLYWENPESYIYCSWKTPQYVTKHSVIIEA